MTAFTLAEKPASKVDMPKEGEHTCAAKGQRRTILVAVITSLVTALVLAGIFAGCGLYWYNNNNNSNTKTNSEEWIFWSRSAGNVTLHESAVINEEEQTALMISAEAYKINDDNSLALHDFKTGFVALRDFNAETCFVGKIQFPDFSYVKKMIEERQGRQLPLQPLARASLRENVMTPSELGPKLTEFCNGVPARWFDEISDNEDVGRFRRDSRRYRRQDKPKDVEPHIILQPQTLCFRKRFEFENELPSRLTELN